MFILYVLYFIATSCYFYICILFKLPESDKMKFLMIIARKKGFFSLNTFGYIQHIYF